MREGSHPSPVSAGEKEVWEEAPAVLPQALEDIRWHVSFLSALMTVLNQGRPDLLLPVTSTSQLPERWKKWEEGTSSSDLESERRTLFQGIDTMESENQKAPSCLSPLAPVKNMTRWTQYSRKPSHPQGEEATS